MTEEIGSEDWLLYISDDEDPGQRSSEAKVEGKGAFPVRVYGSIVNSSKCEGVR